jgi:DNA-binding transcriptional ArsR family regulator
VVASSIGGPLITDTRWKQVIAILAKRGGRFVPIQRGTKGKLRQAWNKTENTLSYRHACSELSAGHNIGLATGTGNLYILDFDNNADRGHECFHLADGLYTYRENAPDRAKFVFLCESPLPTRHDKPNGIELLGLNSNGTHCQGVIAGIHPTGAPIVWGGSNVPVLSVDIVAELWQDWTGKPLFFTPSAADHNNYPSTALAIAVSALNSIPPWSIDYTPWQGMVAAMRDEYGDDALPYVVEWAEGDAGEVEKMWRAYERDYNGRKTTMGTIFYLAELNGWVRPAPVVDSGVEELLAGAKAAVYSPVTIELMKVAGIRRCSDYRNTLTHIVETANAKHSLRVALTEHRLADELGIGKTTAHNHLKVLEAAGFMTIQRDEKGTVVDITPFAVASLSEPLLTKIEERGSLSDAEIGWQNEHRLDDAFASFRYKDAVGLRDGVCTPFMDTLSKAGRELWPLLARGDCDKTGLVEESGFGRRHVLGLLKKYVAAGLVYEKDDGTWALIEQAEERLDEVRPHMYTYGAGQFRAHKEAKRYGKWAGIRLRAAETDRDVDYWRGVIVQCKGKSEAALEWLLANGMDPKRLRSTPKPRQRWDYGEEWRTWGRPLFDNYIALDGVDHTDKVRMLSMAHRCEVRAMRERVDMMLMMSLKRVLYERTELEVYDAVPATAMFQMEMIL